jgi:hypothetical protein
MAATTNIDQSTEMINLIMIWTAASSHSIPLGVHSYSLQIVSVSHSSRARFHGTHRPQKLRPAWDICVTHSNSLCGSRCLQCLCSTVWCGQCRLSVALQVESGDGTQHGGEIISFYLKFFVDQDGFKGPLCTAPLILIASSGCSRVQTPSDMSNDDDNTCPALFANTLCHVFLSWYFYSQPYMKTTGDRVRASACKVSHKLSWHFQARPAFVVSWECTLGCELHVVAIFQSTIESGAVYIP